MENREKEILRAAEDMVRKGGYNSFSFRDVADAIGIKSSSVHYHFSTKADLGVAVAAYYTEMFLDALGNPDELITANKDPIQVYTKAFREALTKDERMCLCGLLGAEVNGLPPEVAAQTKVFFKRNIEWLTQAHTLQSGRKGAKNKALHTLALLEGAMIVSNVLGDIEAFDKAVLI
jgi:TetR/AcrR family transcriptional regulator, transcriptional repressor for nem operon